MLYGELLLPKKVTRRPSVDCSVKNTATARSHESSWHIDPGIEAVRAVLKPVENDRYNSKDECDKTCGVIRPLAVKAFYNTLSATKHARTGQRGTANDRDGHECRSHRRGVAAG